MHRSYCQNCPFWNNNFLVRRFRLRVQCWNSSQVMEFIILPRYMLFSTQYSRKSLKTAEAIMDNFQASFPRAKMFMAPLALLASVSGALGKIERLYPTFLIVWQFLGFYFDKSSDRHLLLYSSLSMLFMFPWTAIAINPTNKVLMDGAAPAKKGEAWVQGMMTTWNRLHGVRSLVSAGACLCLGLYWHNRAIWLGYSSIDNWIVPQWQVVYAYKLD